MVKKTNFWRVVSIIISFTLLLPIGSLIPPFQISNAVGTLAPITATLQSDHSQGDQSSATTTVYHEKNSVANAVYPENHSVSKSVYSSLSSNQIYLQDTPQNPFNFNGKRVVKEVVEKRTHNSKQYLLEDGSYESVVSLGDLNYQDEEGNWQNINTTLVDEADLEKVNAPLSKEVTSDAKSIMSQSKLDRSNTYFRVLQAPYDLKIPKDYSKGYSIGHGSDKLMFIPEGANSVTGTVYQNRIEYHNVWVDTDVALEALSDGVKESLTFNSPESPTTIRFEVKGNLDGRLGDNSLQVNPAWLEDANGIRRNIKQSLANENGKTYIRYTLDLTGLEFPIIMDPSVSLGYSTAQSIDSDGNYFSNDLRIGSYCPSYCIDQRGFLTFDLSPIPSHSTITSAILGLSASSISSNFSTYIEADRIASTWNPQTISWISQPSTQESVSVTAKQDWNYLDVTSIVQGWYTGSKPNYGLELLSNESTIDPIYFNTPYTQLTINYNLNPPTNPTIMSPNGNEVIDSLYTITWSPASDPMTTQSSLKYNIQLTLDNGVNWFDILPLSDAGQTSYIYDFKNITQDSNQARVRIRAFDGALWGAWDESNANFTIHHNQTGVPTAVSPVGGISSPTPVSQSPTVSWTFNDPDPGDYQTAYNVTVYNGSSSMYSSGWITGSLTSFTVPATANLIRGTVYNWRVQTKDSYGAISSASSSPMYMKINTLPINTITSYSDGQSVPDNILSFSWNYSDPDGQGQKKFQVVGSKDNWATWSYDSGVIPSTAATFTTAPLSNGTWSFAVRTFDGMEWSNWNYRSNLTLPNSFEPNDDSTHAFPIQYNNTYTTYIGTSSDIDYYKYTAGSNGIDRIVLNPPSGLNYDVYVLDASGNLVASGVRGAGVGENFIYEVTAGATYYIKVIGVGGNYSSTSAYSLLLSPLSILYQTTYQYDSNGNIIGKTTTRK